MTEAAKNITNLRPPEQDFGQSQELEPWLRQKNEPAEWYMRFKCYLDMGSKRSLRAVVASESGTQVNTKEGKKLSDVSVPRAWRRASKLWRWVERTAAYDLAQLEKQAGYLRETANKTRFASKAYRIQLDWLARTLKDEMLQPLTLADRHAAMARLQSVMRDMAREMEGVDGVTLDMCDAAAYDAIKQEMAEGKSKKK
jgi:hypothetical protein